MRFYKAELRSAERHIVWEARVRSLVLDRVYRALLDELDPAAPVTVTFSVVEMEGAE